MSWANDVISYRKAGNGLDIYSVGPETASEHVVFHDDFRTRLTTTASRSERAGWSGMLIPHNMHEVDPWMVTGYVGSVTDTLIPLLAVQPACTPPHTAAACASAYATLYGRPLYFNLVAGARDDEMHRIGDHLSHDQRYERLRQYGRILRALLMGEVVDTASDYYEYRKFRLEPRPEVLQQCKIFVAGSSPASLRVATDVADVIVSHPVPYPEWREKFLQPLLASGYSGELGILIGIVCRPRRDEAWQVATDRFPESWISRQETLLKTRSQNVWAQDLAHRAVAEGNTPAPAEHPDCYWLGAFRSGRSSAPFLVGTYADVGRKLGEYADSGVSHVLLSGSYDDDDDFGHIGEGIRLTAATS
jgi:alkanesulfonate monooxygenase